MNLLGASFRIGSLFGINIRIHILFLFWIAFRMYQSLDWHATGMFMALLFGIVLLHELGHCFGARSVGGDAKDIMMWPLGGLAFAYAPMRPWPQFVTVACGPLVNVVFCFISALYIVIVTRTFDFISLNPLAIGQIPLGAPYALGYVGLFYDVNLFILAFNLLPIYPLDGGQLFQAIIWPFVGLQRATMLACQVGLAGCLLLGVWSLSRGGGGMLFFIAIFGGYTCWQRLQALKYGMVVEDPSYEHTARPPRRGGGFWSRFFKRGPRVQKPAATRGVANPNPGGWEAKQSERERMEAELDRILKKVSDQGVHSLSYVERQTLERATRERQKREHELERQHRR